MLHCFQGHEQITRRNWTGSGYLLERAPLLAHDLNVLSKKEDLQCVLTVKKPRRSSRCAVVDCHHLQHSERDQHKVNGSTLEKQKNFVAGYEWQNTTCLIADNARPLVTGQQHLRIMSNATQVFTAKTFEKTANGQYAVFCDKNVPKNMIRAVTA